MYTFIFISRYIHTCVCVRVCLCVCVCLLCGAVFRQWSFAVDCLSLSCVLLSVLLRAGAVAVAGFCGLLGCLRMLHRPCAVLLAGCLRDQMFFFFSLLPRPPSLYAPVCRFEKSPCIRSKSPHLCRRKRPAFFEYVGRSAGIHGEVLNVHTEAF